MPDEDEKRRFISEDEDPDRWYGVLDDATGILSDAGIPYTTIGSLALVAFGEDTSGNDIDLLVKPEDADRALGLLAAAGYETERPEPAWLYKATKDDVLVDLLFLVGDEIKPDDEMFERSSVANVRGHDVLVISPEDFLVMQAVSNKEEEPSYWFKGLRALRCGGLDWDYVLRRSDVNRLRVLSLLIYGRSDGIDVPDHVIGSLLDRSS